MILSTAAEKNIEEVAQTLGDSPRWYQLYWPDDRALTKSFVQRAEAAGYSAIVITLDTKLLAWRPRDLQNAYLPFLKGQGIGNYTSDPVFRDGLEQPPETDMMPSIGRWSELFSDKSVTWDDVAYLRECTKLPIVVKGVLHPDDARLAIDHGIDGVIVSNHGGRQVDGSVGALEILPEVVHAAAGKLAILFDSGIRTGADIVKAIALGADAVLIGRPYVWGLGLEGEAGVEEVLRRILADFDLTVALCGATSLADLNADLLRKV
jgi:isopentenyl diphosphate isomerase/L-lactate dehydrogenase-like FMN-dependent dehydrogenase